jgi:hypothetical protein
MADVRQLSLFTIPKPFTGLNAVIQRNALNSWIRLTPRPRIFLFGDDEGTSRAASEFRVEHVSDIARSSRGTPLIGDAFNRIEGLSESRVFCYTNADMMYTNELLDHLGVLASRRARFLVTGRRWNVEMREPWNFSGNWEKELSAFARSGGTLYHPGGLDYFAFARGAWDRMPPLVVGRPGWDNWLIYKARSLRIPVVDATEAILAIHQNHDYAHVPDREGKRWQGPEARENLELAGGWEHIFTLEDATHRLTARGLERNVSRGNMRRRLSRIPVLHPFVAPVYLGLRNLYRKLLRIPGPTQPENYW